MADVTDINAVGGSWNRDGVLIYGSAATGLIRVSAGGTPSPVTALEVSRKETRHALPTFLPDGRHFLYLRASALIPENSGVYLGSLDVKPEEQNSTRLVATTFGATHHATFNSIRPAQHPPRKIHAPLLQEFANPA